MPSPAKVSSPCWKRPSDVMKARIRKGKTKRILLTKLCLQGNDGLAGISTDTDQRDLKHRHKRLNPFSNNKESEQSTKQPAVSATNMLEEEESFEAKEKKIRLFGLLDSLHIKQQDSVDVVPAENVQEAIPESASEVSISDPVKIEGSTLLPVDWSMKTKIRFTSLKSFDWCVNLPTVQQASGTSAFVKCQDLLEHRNAQNSRSSEFHRHCLYWMHPSLPWVSMFPRITSANKISNIGVIGQKKELQDSLLSDWRDSFLSLFQLLRSKYCPYFYFCTHQFTALFQAGGIAGISRPHVILTPTTRGLREALTKEGIDFVLPLSKKRASSEKGSSMDNDKTCLNNAAESGASGEILSNSSREGELARNAADSDEGHGANDEEDGDDIGLFPHDEGASLFLESIGLPKESFPELEPNRVKLQREKYLEVDRRPESTIYVEGRHCQSLFNYLLNSKSCFAITGYQAGVPPTLLAPVAFQGATLKQLKVKHNVMSHGEKKKYTLELTGPILPSTLPEFCNLFKTMQEEFSVSISSENSSSCFNRVFTSFPSQMLDNLKNVPSAVSELSLDATTFEIAQRTGSDHLQNCGLHVDMAKAMSASPADAVTIKDVMCRDGLFSINVRQDAV